MHRHCDSQQCLYMWFTPYVTVLSCTFSWASSISHHCIIFGPLYFFLSYKWDFQGIDKIWHFRNRPRKRIDKRSRPQYWYMYIVVWPQKTEWPASRLLRQMSMKCYWPFVYRIILVSGGRTKNDAARKLYAQSNALNRHYEDFRFVWPRYQSLWVSMPPFAPGTLMSPHRIVDQCIVKVSKFMIRLLDNV